MLPSVRPTTSAPETFKLSRLNGWPIRSPADASTQPSRIAVARLGADAVCYSFIVADFHRLLLAGFAGAPVCLISAPSAMTAQGRVQPIAERISVGAEGRKATVGRKASGRTRPPRLANFSKLQRKRSARGATLTCVLFHKSQAFSYFAHCLSMPRSMTPVAGLGLPVQVIAVCFDRLRGVPSRLGNLCHSRWPLIRVLSTTSEQ